MKSQRDLLEALDQLVAAVAGAAGSDEAQALLAGIEGSGEGVLPEVLAFCLKRGDQAAADFLALSALLANDLGVREQAAQALAELEGRGVSARSPFLAPLRARKILVAYVATAGQGRGHRLLTLWRRERALAQAYVFSLDAEGALANFEASRNLTASQAEELTGKGGVRVNLKEAAGLLRRGLTVARAKGLPLPEDYARQHRFIEESVFGK